MTLQMIMMTIWCIQLVTFTSENSTVHQWLVLLTHSERINVGCIYV